MLHLNTSDYIEGAFFCKYIDLGTHVPTTLYVATICDIICFSLKKLLTNIMPKIKSQKRRKKVVTIKGFKNVLAVSARIVNLFF